jgi:uncharacterized protein (DUF1800 family)
MVYLSGSLKRRFLPIFLVVFFACLPALAQTPGEVTNIVFPDSATLTWDSEPSSDDYNIYRGLLSDLQAGRPPRCHANEVVTTSLNSAATPSPGQAWVYLATGESDLGGEGTAGNETGGTPRATMGNCDEVVRRHMFTRIGFGWNEYVRDRAALLGNQGFLDEQLDPASIDESTNTELNNRLNSIEPPENISELQGISMVRAVYGRRQLEQAATLFWGNHFNTEYSKLRGIFGVYADGARRNLETVTLQHRETEEFRDLAFNGNFREILEASALSPAMIVFLDTQTNILGRPNENFAREILELHTQGVNGGYTHHEIDELARVFTGWKTCKHRAYDVSNPLAVCIPNFLLDTENEPRGDWVRHFTTANHDCGEKTLYPGTLYEAVIPDTCDYTDPLNPVPTTAGMNDVSLALDALAAHPSTAEYISTKLLQRFVTENPTQAMIDAVVLEWNDAGNPNGMGDLREVLRSVLSLPEASDPDFIANKVRDPFEHTVAAFRATRGKTNGYSNVRNYLVRMGHLYHQNPIPTGWSELGGDWVDTNNLLERQKFALDLTPRTGNNFGTDLILMLQQNGISTAVGNTEAIVDFFVDSLFGGALAPAERQAAIDYLNTDDGGVVSNYNDARIRETVGFMMGYAQFLEQ